MVDEQFIDNSQENSGGPARYDGLSFVFGFGEEL